MILTDFRLRRKSDNKIFHFIEGYKATVGPGPIIWTAWVYDIFTHSSQWQKVQLLDEMVEKQPFIGLYDNTKWGKLTQSEMDFWNCKGFNFDNWKGKPIYVTDIVRFVCEGHAEKLEVMKLNHIFALKDKDGCVKEIPADPKVCQMFVIGNESQDPDLINNFK